MANPKITITLTVDQNLMDALSAHTAALNRFCDMNKCEVVLDDKSTIAPTESAPEPMDTNVGVIPETPSPAPTWTMNTGAGAAPMNPVADTVPGVVPTMPVTAPVAPVMPIQATSEVTQQHFTLPTTAPDVEITIETLMRAGVDLMNKGVNAAAVLTEFKVQTLTELPKEQYPAMAARLRQLGANI